MRMRYRLVSFFYFNAKIVPLSFNEGSFRAGDRLIDKNSTLNLILVQLFREINMLEERAIISGEFQDITNNDMHVIEAIGLNSEKNMSSIAAELSVTVGTLTTAMNSLVKKGYVLRRRGEKDKRVVYISLSDKGKRAYLHHENFHKSMIDAVTQKLDSEKVELLLNSLQEISKFLETWKGPK